MFSLRIRRPLLGLSGRSVGRCRPSCPLSESPKFAGTPLEHLLLLSPSLPFTARSTARAVFDRVAGEPRAESPSAAAALSASVPGEAAPFPLRQSLILSTSVSLFISVYLSVSLSLYLSVRSAGKMVDGGRLRR